MIFTGAVCISTSSIVLFKTRYILRRKKSAAGRSFTLILSRSVCWSLVSTVTDEANTQKNTFKSTKHEQISKYPHHVLRVGQTELPLQAWSTSVMSVCFQHLCISVFAHFGVFVCVHVVKQMKIFSYQLVFCLSFSLFPPASSLPVVFFFFSLSNSSVNMNNVFHCEVDSPSVGASAATHTLTTVVHCLLLQRCSCYCVHALDLL